MSLEIAVAALATSTTALTTAVGVQQSAVVAAVAKFDATTTRVNALNLVENTADLSKPASNATITELAKKQNTLVSGVNISTVNGQSLLGGEPLVIARGATSLNRVAYNDRGTLRTTTSQLDDSTLVEGLGLFMWINTQEEPDDDETCFNTSAGQWLLAAPAWDLIDAWNSVEQNITDDWREDEPARFAEYLLNNK